MLDTRSLRRLGIMLWQHDEYSFRHAGSPIVIDDWTSLSKVPFKKITGVHVADFGNDGTLDMLVMDGSQGWLFFGDRQASFNGTQPAVIPDIPPECTVMDADADFVPDVFVAYPNGTRGFWTYRRDVSVEEDRENQAGKIAYVPWPGSSVMGSDGKACKVVDAVSIAFVDIDGDCLADLVIPTTCGLEVWSNPAQSKRKFWDLRANRTGQAADVRLLGLDVFNYARGDMSLAFADFDGDGTLDIGVPNSNRRDMSVYINRQKRRKSGEACSRDKEWTVVKKIGVGRNDMNIGKSRIGPMFGGIDVPATIHVGDYDLDGMSDILVIEGGRPALFRNEGKWKNGGEEDVHFRKMDGKVQKELTKGIRGGVSGMFFDMDESGRQDLLIVGGNNETRLIWNNMQGGWDSLFFKGTMLSGLGYHLEPRPFAPVAGNSVKISYMERESRERVTRTCSQCGQSGHWQLRVCNCQFGLKHIANYIEELWVGGGASTRSWGSLMPNSMAVIWGEGGSDSSSWWMEYFTQRRGSQMLRVSGFLVVALAGLAACILVLQDAERRKDREEDEEERARLFNFV